MLRKVANAALIDVAVAVSSRWPRVMALLRCDTLTIVVTI